MPDENQSIKWRGKALVMYTVEFNHDLITIITLDERGEFADVEVTLADNGSAFIAQHDEESGSSDMIMLSQQQLLDIVAFMNSTEGMYKLRLGGDF